MELAVFIKAYRDSHNISQREFARRCGLSNTQISFLERNINGSGSKSSIKQLQPSIETLKRIASGMGITLNELLSNVDELGIEVDDSSLVEIPILGSVSAGFGNWAILDNGRMPVLKQWLHGRKPEEFFLLRVFGDSMSPDYQEGDFVLCLITKDMGRSGRVGVIVDAYGNATIKKIVYPMSGSPDYGKWLQLVPINTKYDPILVTGEELNNYFVQGRVLMVIREVDQP